MKYLFVLLLGLMITGCNMGMPEDFDYGHVSNGRYVNKYFGLTMKLPEGWTMKSRAGLDSLDEIGNKLIAGNDMKKKAMLKVSAISNADLFMASEPMADSLSSPYTASMILQAENVKRFGTIKSGEDYLRECRKTIMNSTFKYDKVDEEFTAAPINGTEFYSMGAKKAFNGVELQQKYFSAIVKGFSLNIILTYYTQEQLDEMMKSVGTLRIKRRKD